MAILVISTAACLSPEYQHLKKGNKYFDKGELDKAIAEYNSALEINPEFIEALGSRGSAYVEKGQYEKGIENYSKIIELDPQNNLALWQRSTAYILNKQYQKAINDCETALSQGMNSHFIYKNMGVASSNLERYDDAILYFREAQNISPSAEFDAEMEQCIIAVQQQMQAKQSK